MAASNAKLLMNSIALPTPAPRPGPLRGAGRARRVGEGAAMIRTKGEAGTGDVVEAVRHARTVLGQ